MKAMPPRLCDDSPQPDHARPPSRERSGRIEMHREQVRHVDAKQQRRPGNQTRGKDGERERWDSRRGLKRNMITLQAAILGVNASDMRARCKGMILCRYIYF